MTKDEYYKLRRELDLRAEEIREQINELRKKYIKCCPLKAGDFVTVVNNEKRILCFVGEVKVHWSNNYDFAFNKIKKDGKMSGQSAGIYWWGSIEKDGKIIITNQFTMSRQ